MFIHRLTEHAVRAALDRQAAVALLGPRQVGKTTLARVLGASARPSTWTSRTRPDRAKLAEPAPYLERPRTDWSSSTRSTACLSCSRRCAASSTNGGARRTGGPLPAPGFGLHRPAAPIQRNPGRAHRLSRARALHAAGDPPRACRAGRASGSAADSRDSFLAADDGASLTWRADFIRTYLERDIPHVRAAHPRRDPAPLLDDARPRAGRPAQRSRTGPRPGRRAQTVTRYLDLLVDLLLVRRLRP